MKNAIKLLVLSPFVLHSLNVLALTPHARETLAIKLKSEAHLHKFQSLKTNAKGTILESTSTSLSTPENWFTKDPELDEIQGVSSERVYTELGTPTVKEDIIVAVIDSGVDVNHEDLQGQIWINKAEIPGNGIDDDNNGYIDDVFGWNFIGNEKGMAEIVKDNSVKNGIKLIQGDQKYQVAADTLEVTRELKRLMDIRETRDLTDAEEEEFIEVEKEVKSNRDRSLKNYKYYNDNLNLFNATAKVLKEEGGLTEVTYEAVENFKPTSIDLINARKDMLEMLDRGFDLPELREQVEYYNTYANIYYNVNFDSRRDIVKDDYTNTDDQNYGNNNVIGPDAFHGTHVSGIIAATRNNKIGINGIASKVKIMALRAVPNGDERDKDIANAIRYAVDNGAKIINMSFGKAYSPYKDAVDKAVAYAEANGVVLVHAAGNSNHNNDDGKVFPNNDLIADNTEALNWLEIGASSFKIGSSFAASFSNYGKATVDLFAPGVNLYSTTPDNKYSDASGTSMATPATAGALALILSYADHLTPMEAKDLMIKTRNTYADLKVYKSGLGYIPFSDLSINAGTPNAYKAITEALSTKPAAVRKPGFFRRLLSKLKIRRNKEQ